jgi:hypothetical protein
MNTKPGYYSLVQFCPDASRLESVNVGLILFCPTLDYLDVKLAERNDRIIKVFGKTTLRPHSLDAAKQAIANRLRSASRPRSIKDLQEFIDSRGNDLIISIPRSVKVCDPAKELRDLFKELVEVPKIERGRSILPSRLLDVFEKLVSQGRAQKKVKVEIPMVGRSLHVPFAFQNGVLNLVKPQLFSSKEEAATDAAMRLALEGDLLARHSPANNRRQLIVVADFAKSSTTKEFGKLSATKELKRAIGEILRTYHVQPVLPEDIEEFAKQVMKEAHG